MEPHPFGQALLARDHDGLVTLLADDVVFHSPVITDPGFEGRDSVAALLAMVLDSIFIDEYTHELGEEHTRILVGNARVLGKPIKVTTVLEFNADGKIREIWVMVRPLTGVVAIAEAIGSRLAERQGPGRGPAVRVLSKPLAGLAVMTDRIGSGLIAALNRSTAWTNMESRPAVRNDRVPQQPQHSDKRSAFCAEARAPRDPEWGRHSPTAMPLKQ